MTFEEWHEAGLDHLLRDCPFSELCEMLTGSADQIADFLRRGMRSTVRTRITGFRNLAESIAVHFHAAADFRVQGHDIAQSQTLSAALYWFSRIPGSLDRVYALLGITDAMIP
ncbi:MAG: hypothetical protein KDA78_20790 [Planctomycetaceae bacterium]|nr:hypothetical protein [Planctomycetaceae bacterium]